MTQAMMTGPEHFTAAEKLLDRVDAMTVEDESSRMVADTLLQAALVHVQLAMVSLNVEGHLLAHLFRPDHVEAWRELMGLT